MFVVHEHHATRDHWDLRLEIDGVLASWAVPNGPSMTPEDKRLAVKVEVHPLEYVDFEAVIPEGNYGAGPMVVWDRGRFLPKGDPVEGIRQGEVKFELYGFKLRGQNGAPLSLVLPWKYGFKGAKSIVKIRFTREQPQTTRNRVTPREYGFYGNVNPALDHPQ